jgi:23S rRNA (uracil1939-C5)-methyltransferase
VLDAEAAPAATGTAPARNDARPRPGEELDLRVEGLVHGGAGIARRDGYVVFVEDSLPGDRVRAKVLKSKRDYARARTVELLEPGPDRVPERCDHDGQRCPGSPWQGLRYDRQLEHKQGQVEDALTRLGGLEGHLVEPIVPAVTTERYRNKMEYSFGTGPDGELALGFHARGQWERVENARDCVLASERSNAVRNFVRDWCVEEGLSAHDRRTHSGFLRNLVVREGRRTGDLQVRLVTSEGDFRSAELAQTLETQFGEVSVLWTRTDAAAEVSHGGITTPLAGSQTLREQISSLRFRISPEAFFQTNTEMAERLYELAADYAALNGRERIFDIYCGIGTLSLVMALHSAEVWGVDIAEQAIADAIENARLNEIDNTRFFAGDARKALRPLIEEAGRPEVVVVDPPRAGLSQKVVRRLLESQPRRIVYVSCNPTTLAPNARQMVEAGFELIKVRPVDMFPHTPHIECVALLERRGE